MKRASVILVLVLVALSAFGVQSAAAQTEVPPTPAGPIGQVTGTLINRNTGKLVSESLEVMLHVLDKDFVDQNMLHAQSSDDGTFIFEDVPFAEGLQFAVMTVYEGATYTSDTVPVDMTSLKIAVEVPVYESTPDLSALQVEQMHVLFDLAEDGLETKEIYVVSNPGDRTVKDAYQLEDGKTATLQFPLPSDADYIFFKPDDQDRFVKLNGGFADTYPIPPGTQSTQFMVTYLVPYSREREYTYTAPMAIAQMNFLLPDQGNLALQGAGLMGPESMSLPNGGSYQMYTYPDLKAGQTVSLTITGRNADPAARATNVNTSIAVGAGILGLLIIGAGLIWWRRNNGVWEEDEGAESGSEFDRTVNEIARLDEAHERGNLDEVQYREERQVLRERARALLDQLEEDDRRE
ncbi:MAG TPA: hypothetical protein VIU41_10095 [Geobacteraceae bacterium]